MKAHTRRVTNSLAVSALALVLSACGGGGGGDGAASDDGSSNSSPVSDAGSDLVVNVGEVVILDGSLSRDADGDELGYFWSLESRPVDSEVYFYDEQTSGAKLANTRAGEYVVNLVVSDGAASSTSTVTVAVMDLGGAAPVRDPVRPEIDALMDFGVLSIKTTLGDPDDFAVLDSPTWVTHAPGDPDTGAVTFTITPKLDNDASTRVGSKVYCHASWDGGGFWEALIFDDLSTCAVYIDDQDAFGAISADPLRFELLEEGVTSFGRPTIGVKVTNYYASETVYSVSCSAQAIDGLTIVDTAHVSFAGSGSIAPNRSAVDEGVFFNLTSLDGLDIELECRWLTR